MICSGRVMNLKATVMCFRRVLHHCVWLVPKRPGSQLCAYPNSRHVVTGQFVDDHPSFRPKRALLLTKMTRYEYEKKVCGAKTDDELKKYVGNSISLKEVHVRTFTHPFDLKQYKFYECIYT